MRSWGEMTAAEFELIHSRALYQRLRLRIGVIALSVVLAAFTLSTMDGEELAPHIVSAAMLLVAAFYFAFSWRERWALPVPAICLLLMTTYGAAQTLWLPQKIAYDGWVAVLFWFTAAAIALLAAEIFREREL